VTIYRLSIAMMQLEYCD